MTRVTMTVTVELEKTVGKFVAGDDLLDALIAELEGADPGSVDVDESEYEVTSFIVEAA